jgi:hypothetical protein
MLKDMRLQERGFPSIVEELYLLKKAGARFEEIPYVLTSRSEDQNGSKFRYTMKTFYSYLKYCVKAVFVSAR